MSVRCLILLLACAPMAHAESSAVRVERLVLEVSTHLEWALKAALSAERARLTAQRLDGEPLAAQASIKRARARFDTMDVNVQEMRKRLMRLSEVLMWRGQLGTAGSVDGMRLQLDDVDRGTRKGMLRHPSATLRALNGRFDLIKRRLAREG